MSDRKVCRWAALSLSNIASVFFPDLLGREQSSFEHKLVAVSSTKSQDAVKPWLNTQSVPNAESITIFSSWEQMLEKGDFDIVYISSPHSLHFQHVMKALSCNRSVLVEKPATMNAAQYEHCIDLATEKKLVLMEAMWTRYLPATQFLTNTLLPKVGPVRRVFADFSFPIVSPEMSHDSRFLDKGAGAGSLLDQGCYALTWADLALNSQAVGETKVLHSSSMSVPGVPGEVDDINTIILGQASATGIVTTSMTLPGSSQVPFYKRLQAKKQAPSVRIETEKATIAIPFPPIRPEEIQVTWYGSAETKDGLEVDEVFKKPIDGWGIWYQADVIASSVMGGHSEIIGADESLRILRWMDAARSLAGIRYPKELDSV
ncbi:hypothetical protein LTR70_010085 [Exophiala xenobiotica]|uniref:D-xylose 1-dehydrogenase (NADP(+), D-xylono-1,5-lactone-forming) n=1 Tax=Lithohypha guttulata TaxID=1690604 RepID=A0ABR0JW14_9EURO|nr:hypothetical protein LTR24_010043 [Lithohypha guttulata]KAK5309675.1 hypothetical protein LTR70_010085 [Exophiala xenobiotica]